MQESARAMPRRRAPGARQHAVRHCRRRRRGPAGRGRTRPRRRPRDHDAEPCRAGDEHVRGLAARRGGDPRQPGADPAGGAVPARGRRRDARGRGRRLGSEARERVPDHRRVDADGGQGSGRTARCVDAGRTRAADLHQRHDRASEGRHARSRERQRDRRANRQVVRDGHRHALPAGTAALPRQRDHDQRGVAAARRRLDVRRRVLRRVHLLGHGGAGAADLLLRSTDDLRDAGVPTRQRSPTPGRSAS